MSDPPFRYIDVQLAQIEGLQRRFGHPSIRNWGSRRAPAPTSSLVHGGSVIGAAYRVDHDTLGVIIGREASQPTETQIRLDHRHVDGFTWTMTDAWADRSLSWLAGAASRNIDAGGGPLGDALDYARTVSGGLRTLDASDPYVDAYLNAVEATG